MREKAKILLVDDEKNFLHSLKDTLELEGYEISTAANGFLAVGLLETQRFDVVISDIRMPKMSGVELLQQISGHWPQTIVFMLTGYGSILDAVKCIKLGAENYILKPVNIADLLQNVRQALNGATKIYAHYNSETTPLVGESQAIKDVHSYIQKIADSDLSVLISGESGTGKELVASAIYHNSARNNRPFQKINCAALPDHLLESELFGFEPGAFTDAKKLKKGKLELAHEGTLFLDEIGDMPFAMQAKLLRVLEEKKVERLGGNRTIATDFRLISATNQNLKSLIENRKFREDLFFRLNTFQIKLPALREIPEDIPILANAILRAYCEKRALRPPKIHTLTIERLLHYSWPGNVRELRNVMHRAIVLSNGINILPEHLPEALNEEDVKKKQQVSGFSSLEDVEKEHIEEVLKITGGNRNRTASILNIHRDTLYRKLKKYKIEV